MMGIEAVTGRPDAPDAPDDIPDAEIVEEPDDTPTGEVKLKRSGCRKISVDR